MRARRPNLCRPVTWMLGLDQDFSEFYALCQDEPKLAGVQAAAKGRLLRSPTLFEDVVKTILTTNTAWSGTKRMVSALVEAYGARIDGVPGDGGDAARAFPTPAALAGTERGGPARGGQARLPGAVCVGAGAAGCGGRAGAGCVEVAGLDDCRNCASELMAIKGVGAYAAAIASDVAGPLRLSAGGLVGAHAVSREWHGGEPVGEKEIEAAFAEWGEWKGLAYWFWEWSDTA